MQELKYQLVKEDYQDWIHWNVARHSMKKMKIITACIYVAFFIFYVGSSIVQKKEPVAVFSSLIVVLLLGAFMFYIISPQHQERTIWKRSGLSKLEKTKGFPKIYLMIREDGVKMEVPEQICKDYSYTEVTDLEETPRLYLIGTADRSWQFVAKSAFDSTEQGEEFKSFMLEKIEDAKENPEKYKKAEEVPEISSAEAGDEQDGHSGSDVEGEEALIKHVDTSSMGKIGKMANLIAAMSEDEGTSEELPEEIEEELKVKTAEAVEAAEETEQI